MLDPTPNPKKAAGSLSFKLFRMLLNERGEIDTTPEPAPEPTPAPIVEAPVEPTPSAYDDLKSKKGFKSDDDVAKSYGEVEVEMSRRQSMIDTTKKDLETQGYTLDDKGKVVPINSGQPVQQAQPNQPGVETLYDPYTGTPLTDPIQIQLARMPIGQREIFIYNSMADQRDNQQREAFNHDSEVLSKPEAKGFEDDVRKVISKLPIAQRAVKKVWEDTLLQVKGARYDNDKKNWHNQGAEDLINKEGVQPIPGQGGGESGKRLTSEQESQFQYYQKSNPGMFRDRAHFLSRCNPSGA